MSSFTTPPIRPVRIALDKEQTAAELRPLKSIQEDVMRRFARVAGVHEQTAKLSVSSLLKEVGVLALLRWHRAGDGEGVKAPARESKEELTCRSERLNAAAVDALIGFYLEGRHNPDDARFAETRRSWEAYDSQNRLARFHRRRRTEASARYRAAWQDWGSSQEI
jgi:hypothetical protein